MMIMKVMVALLVHLAIVSPMISKAVNHGETQQHRLRYLGQKEIVLL